MKKQFIVEMDTDTGCELSHHCVATCQHSSHMDRACKADIENRPDFCPLVEIKETSPYWEHKF